MVDVVVDSSGGTVTVNGTIVRVDTRYDGMVNINIFGNVSSLQFDKCDRFEIIGDVVTVTVTGRGDVCVDGDVTGDINVVRGDVCCYDVGGSVTVTEGDVK